MPSVNPSKVIFYSGFKYFSNYDIQSASLTIPATSIATGTAINSTLLIPSQNVRDFSQIRINYSVLPNDWYVFPNRDVRLDANFTISTVGSFTSSGIQLTFYVVNQTPSTATSTAVTITPRVYLFDVPN